MKFSYDYIVDESDAKQLPNGTWTGIWGLLNRSEIDYCPSAFIVTEESWEQAAYNYPFASDEITFVTKKPEYSPEIMSLFRTLSLNVWLSLLACIIRVTLACFVVLKHRCPLEDILLHVLAIGLNQEGNLVPKRLGEALLLCTWTGAMAVFTFCLKSVLLSFLTFPPLNGVRTVPELASAIRAGQYGAFGKPAEELPILLKRSSVEDIRVIGENILKNPRNYVGGLVHTNLLGTEYPNWAHVALRSYVSYVDGKMYVSKDNMASCNVATAVSKKFCCKDEMDMLILRFLAAGINIRINRYRYHQLTWIFSFYYMPEDGESTIRKLTITDLSGAFILLVAGHCLSLCVLIVERWLKRKEKRRFSTRKKKSRDV